MYNPVMYCVLKLAGLVVWAARVPLCTLNGVIYIALFLGEEVHVRKHMAIAIALTTLTQMVMGRVRQT